MSHPEMPLSHADFKEGHQACNIGASDTSPKEECGPREEIEALILFPSLGLPQILEANPKKCTLVIATNTYGESKLSNPCKGAVLVNRHLRLMSMSFDKAKLPCDWKLYSGVKDSYYEDKEDTPDRRKELREKYIEINPLCLSKAKGSYLLYERAEEGEGMPIQEDTETASVPGRPLGRLSPDAIALYEKAGFNKYFTVTLKNLSEAKPDDTPQSWAWIVTTRCDHKFSDPIDNKDRPARHQPLDRLIRNAFCKLAKEDYSGSKGAVMDVGSLYEIPVEEGEYAAPKTENPSRRVQAWHPVITKLPGQAIKLGHLTDSHISVRAATIARAPVRVIEDDKADGPHFEEVGGRVAHTYKSFKVLVDAMKDSGADALAITGDVIDFNRNLDPERTKDQSTVKDIWTSLNALANAFKPEGGYRRCIDHLYFYSLLVYAAREKGMPAYYVTGNHEGYQWPYGISPRVDADVINLLRTKFAGSKLGDSSYNYSADLDNHTDDEKQAFLKLRDALEARDRLEKKTDPPATQEEINAAEDNIREAKAKYSPTTEARAKFFADAIEEASAYHQKKAVECIPSDHNITIFEACLAYGPTYGQILTSRNFRREQFDWIHWLYSPFTDFNAYPGCNDLYGAGAKNAVTLLGWGPDERMLPDNALVLAVRHIFGKLVEIGEDRRGAGWLPYATDSINPHQLGLIKSASQAKAANWAVMSHFTVASYEDKVPVTIKDAGFWPGDEQKTGLTRSRNRAQYNVFNWGGCELGLKTYLQQFTNCDGSPHTPGKVKQHLSGHSHRCGIYTLKKNPHGDNEFSVEMECKIPEIPGPLKKLPTPAQGTCFVVGTTAGPMGKQSLPGWCKKAKGWEASEYGESLLGGWLTRPPSGLLVDMGSGALTYVKSSRPQNDIPRLAVMLDYRELMSVAEGGMRPLVLCPDEFIDEMAYLDKNHDPAEGFAVTLSDEIKQLDCLKLDQIRLWVYKKGKNANTEADEEPDGDGVVPATPATTGGWQSCGARIDKEKGRFFLEDNGALVQAALMPILVRTGIPPVYIKGVEVQEVQDVLDRALARDPFRQAGGVFEWQRRDGYCKQAVLSAFMEIPLQRPNYPNAPWDEVKYEGEAWVFPVNILQAYVKTPTGHVNTTFLVIRRGMTASGEVPNWDFLSNHYKKKYPVAKDAIDPDKTAKAVPSAKES